MSEPDSDHPCKGVCSGWKQGFEKGLKSGPSLNYWRLNLLKAIEAQAKDETLWCEKPTIGEAYLQQSLRWLHRVIEENDLDALAQIIAQSEDKEVADI